MDELNAKITNLLAQADTVISEGEALTASVARFKRLRDELVVTQRECTVEFEQAQAELERLNREIASKATKPKSKSK